MKALRRSIKGDKNDSKLQHISVTPKSAVAIVPPKKVIRALYDYEAQNGQELSFQKGDFFHVIARENDTDWYEACNPAVPDARGLVPVNFFQALGKTERDSGQSTGSAGSAKAPDHDSGYSDTTPGQAAQQQQQQQQGPNPQRLSKLGKGSGAMVYGIVMYDFAAERPDELEAKAGEAIIVIAQSNPEWFVAKPIGRLGGPGLIPVSFIEIRDMTTGQAVPDSQEAVQRAGVPKVEEWKKMAADYKNSSITLGKFEASNQQQQQQQGMEQDMGRMSLQQAQQRQSQQAGNGQSYQSLRQSQQAKSQQQQNQQYAAQQHAAAQQAATSQLFSPVSAHIPRYWFSEDKYWFVIEAALEDGRHWELQRYYEDFYDFQIALLTEFPAEAGNTGTQKRSLPYMPGPVNYVTDQITDGRRHNLDAYVKNLLTQPPYISRCTLVKQFFAPREGDFEIDPDAPDGYRDSAGSQQSSTGTPADDRGGSKADLNGAGYGGLTAAPPRQQGPPGGGFPAQAASREVGQQQSQASLQAAGGAMKVKIYFGDDLFAIRVPAAISYVALHEKIRERLKIPGGEEIAMMWQEGGGRASLESEADLGEALARGGGKLVVFVEYR